MVGLDVLAKAALNPEAEYDRASLAALGKLRSSHCRPQLLTEVLSNEDAYSKALATKLRANLNHPFDLREEANRTAVSRAASLIFSKKHGQIFK